MAMVPLLPYPMSLTARDRSIGPPF